MRIGTGDQPPIKLRPYRTAIQKRPLVDKVVRDMLEAWKIERSESPWSFLIVGVDKKVGRYSFYVDWRLNEISKPLAVFLSLIDDILALLGKANYFFTIDMKSG